MPDLFIGGEPGIRTAKTQTPRHVFRQAQGALFRAGLHRIDGTKARDPGNGTDIGILRPGLLMGKITGGLYAPSAYGVTLNAEAAASVAIEVTSAVATEIVRRRGATGTFKLIGPPTAAGTVNTETVTYSAINTGTGVITVTAITNAFVVGSLVAPVDGSELPLTFIANEQQGGIQVVDTDGTSFAAVEFTQLPIGGVIDAAQLLPWPADDSTRRFILGQLNRTTGGQFIFADFDF